MKNYYKRSFHSGMLMKALSILAFSCLGIGAQAQTLPPNIDFAFGNFSNWSVYTGTAITGSLATGPVFSGAVLSGPVSGRHAITTGSGTDPIGGFPVVSPNGPLFSCKVGNTNVGAEAERARYYIHVPVGTTKFAIQYQFAVVFEDPSHLQSEQPSFQVVAYDSASGAIIPSANNLYVSGPSLPGFIPFGGIGSNQGYYLNWTANTVNLGGMGGQTVILEVTVCDCSLGGHFGYGYFDATAAINHLAPTVVLCDQQNNNLKLQGPPGYQYYRWYDQTMTTALNGPADTNRTISLPFPATPQSYKLVVTPFSSLGIPDTLQSNVIGGFTMFASAPTSCAAVGIPIQLTTTVSGSSTGYTYKWSGDTAQLSSLTAANPTATLTKTGTYIVKVTDTNGCHRMDTIQVAVGSYQVSAGPDTTTCVGNAISINATVSPSSSNYSFSWTPGSNLSSASILSPSFSPSNVGTQQYILRVDSGACSISDTLVIRTLPNTFAVSDTTVCGGVTFIPSVQGDTAFSYFWTPTARLTFPASAFPGSDQMPSFAADTTTTFTITASNAACPNIVKYLTVTVEPTPFVSIGSDTTYMNSAFPASLTTTVTPSGYSSYNYSWYPSVYVDSPGNANVTVTGTSDSLLIVTVSTPAGCSASDSTYVVISNSSIAALPNAFVVGSPNNSVFRIAKIMPGYSLNSFRIYDRWGKKVFQTNDATTGWDGSFNGTTLPVGVYIYTVETKSATGERAVQKGNVTLFRSR